MRRVCHPACLGWDSTGSWAPKSIVKLMRAIYLINKVILNICLIDTAVKNQLGDYYQYNPHQL